MNELPDCHYRVSVKALILNETRDKFLICRESVGFWELPGGGLDWGKTPQEDLPREIMEEMGLVVLKVADNPSYFLTGRQKINPGVRFANIMYETTLESLDFTPSDECLEIKFVSKEDLKNLKVFGSVERLAEMFNPNKH